MRAIANAKVHREAVVSSVAASATGSGSGSGSGSGVDSSMVEVQRYVQLAKDAADAVTRAVSSVDVHLQGSVASMLAKLSTQERRLEVNQCVLVSFAVTVTVTVSLWEVDGLDSP